ncbi:hypothetical protein [Cystobacter fuscus]|uniref:hypothetical protein n=1 Tax=Cystobacter fuscus TaxID=43 RepID=UPI0037BE2B9D
MMGTLTQAGAEEANEAPQAAASKEVLKERTPRVNGAELLRRTFDLDMRGLEQEAARLESLAWELDSRADSLERRARELR